MRFLSLCSGIEAASVAWAPLQWEPVAFAEIEPFCSALLAHRFPGTPNLGDITNFKEWPDLGTIDLVCGGTPCQAFSVAGLRKGLDDPRGNLTLTFLAIVDRYRPRWVVWENVVGVLNHDSGRSFASILGGLGLLGYGWCYRVLDAQYVRVHGFPRAVPQRRRRVFLVGYLGDWRGPTAVLSEREGLRGNNPPRRQAGQGTARDTAKSLTNSGRGTARTGEPRGQDDLVADWPADVASTLEAGFGKHQGQENQHVHSGASWFVPVSNSISAKMAKGGGGFAGENECDHLVAASVSGALMGADKKIRNELVEGGQLVAHSLTAEGFDASEDGTGRGPPLVPVPFDTTQLTNKDNRSNPRPGDPSHPLAATAHPPAIAMPDVAAPLLANCDRTTSNAGKMASLTNVVPSSWHVRRLTPLECERLMGFPDEWTNIPYRGKHHAPDGPRYKALGNSWAVNVARWVGYRIAKVEEIIKEERDANPNQ